VLLNSIESAWYQRLKLKYDKLLSYFGFEFNMRRYIEACKEVLTQTRKQKDAWIFNTPVVEPGRYCACVP
jgi:hypothetical protein